MKSRIKTMNWNRIGHPDLPTRESKLQKEMRIEAITNQSRMEKAANVEGLLREMLFLNGGKKDIREIVFRLYKVFGVAPPMVNLKSLRASYWRVNSTLREHKSKSYYERMPHALSAEKQVQDYLWASTKREIFNDVWIGGRQIDLFVPSIALTIEVDGQVHEREKEKIRSDENRDRILKQEFQIDTIRIGNGEILNPSPTQKRMMEMIHSKNRLDSRRLQKMWRGIALSTISYAVSRPGIIGREANAELERLLSADKLLINALIELLDRTKTPLRLSSLSRRQQSALESSETIPCSFDIETALPEEST